MIKNLDWHGSFHDPDSEEEEMGYWVELRVDSETLAVVLPFIAGGVIEGAVLRGGTVVGVPTHQAIINVTYNYNGVYRKNLGVTLREMLDGKQGHDTVEILSKGVAILGTEPDPNYWAPTKGNAGYILSLLLSWAQLHPGATWRVK